jgi:glycine/D-amino acid oxidase-like deaminating enzyme
MFIIGNSGGDHDVSKLSYMKAALKEYNEPYELVATTDIKGLAPHVRFEAHSALWLPGALSVDSHNLMQSLGSFAKQSPMITWHQHPSRSLEILPHEWLVELANGKKISSPKLVLCAGAFSQALLGKHLWLDAGLPNLHFGRGTSVIVGGLPRLPHAIRTPNRALACGLHVVPRDNDQWYIGSTNLFGTRLEGAKGPTCGELHTLLGQTSAELNTSLRNATIVQVGWGLRPVTSNGAPVFGSTKLDGLFIACGTHRQGINVAPELARLVCEEVLQGAGPTHVFSPNSDHEQHKVVDLALGVRSLLATALYPTGEMPYNRQREMEVFLETLLRMALNNETVDNELREKMKLIHESIEMSEQCVIRLFHEVLEEHLPGRAPYVT